MMGRRFGTPTERENWTQSGWANAPNFHGDAPGESRQPTGGRATQAPNNGHGANLRNVWTIPTHSFSEAHFATFPPKLVEPCIKAGTSERGVCKQCGAPWVREVDTPDNTTHFRSGTDINKGKFITGGQKQHDEYVRPKTTGWSPTCQCKPQTSVPATVLDPFAGSGTVALVAQRMNRDAILCEISPEYAEMARKRIEGDAPMFAQVEVQA